MWSGPLTSQTIAQAYQHAADSLFTREPPILVKTPARVEVPPMLEEIQQSFEQARQHQPKAVDARFAHAHVMRFFDAAAEGDSGSKLSDAVERSGMSMKADNDLDVFQQVRA